MITVDDVLNRMQWSVERDAIRSPWDGVVRTPNGVYATIGQTPITAVFMRELIGAILTAINSEIAIKNEIAYIAIADALDLKDPEILEAAAVALITEYQKRTTKPSG